MANRDVREIIDRLFLLSAYTNDRLLDIRSELARRGLDDQVAAIDQLRVDIVNELTADILTLQMYVLERAYEVNR